MGTGTSRGRPATWRSPSRDVDLDEAQAVLAALGALRGRRQREAAAALAELIAHRGMEQASERLVSWATR
jgi:hypothetical protein